MVEQIEVRADRLYTQAPAHRVYTRGRWNQGWTEVPYLYCSRLSFAAAPQFSTAELQWRYGYGQRAGETNFAYIEPLAVLEHYVRIEVDQFDADGEPADPILWHGVITEDIRDRHGAAFNPDTGSAAQAGHQTLIAFGLEMLLDRVTIHQSILAAAAGGGDEQTLERAICFNAGAENRHHENARGNMHPEVSPTGRRVFARAMSGAKEWNAQHMARYLLHYFGPRDRDGVEHMPWKMTTSLSLAWHKPRLDAHGKTIKQLFDELFDRKRLLGWRIEVDDDLEEAIVRVFSHADTDLDLPGSDLVLEANDQLRELNFDASVDVAGALERTSASHVFDQVRVTGARAGTVCTFWHHTGAANELEADWSSAQETAYKAGASASAGYGSLGLAEKRKRNDATRTGDSLARVYRYFRLPTNWNGQSSGGLAVFPYAPVFWRPGLRVAPHLPLLTDHDYSSSAAGVVTIVDNTPTGATPQVMRPFACFNTALADDGVYWEHVDKLAANAGSEHANHGDRDWAAHLHVQDESAGIILSGSHLPHIWAKADWSGFEPTDIEADLDWRGDESHLGFFVTLYLQSDAHVEGIYPEAPPAGLDQVRVLELDAGDDAKLDYIVPGTYLGITDGDATPHVADGGYVRDDRERLSDIARVAYEWYRRERRAFEIPFRQIQRLADVGQMITRIGYPAAPVDVYTVVSEVTYDLLAGTTTLKTDIATFDPIVKRHSSERPLV